jgi:hypothetical protein
MRHFSHLFLEAAISLTAQQVAAERIEMKDQP